MLLVGRLENNDTSIGVDSGKLPGSMFEGNWYEIGQYE
jgi:hypothetical protein